MTHLSSQQISEWTLGERDTAVKRHLEDCRACREEVLRLEEGLRTFRQSAHAWAERTQRYMEAEARPRRLPSPVSWTWATATLLTVAIVLAPIYLDTRHAQTEAQRVEDSLLLDQIHERLGRTVPQSMGRLMDLMNEGKGDQQ